MNNNKVTGHKVQGARFRAQGSALGERSSKRKHGKLSKPHRLWPILFILIAVIFALMVFSHHAQAQTPSRKPVPIEKRIADVEKDVHMLDRQVNIYNLDAIPDYLILCDKKVPIINEDVRERFERELFQILENKGLLTIIVKRYFKYLPTLGEEIQKMSLPPDLIYLAVTESYLNPRSVSSANAVGMWQFIKETGQKEGLHINENIDERYDIKTSTRSALAHLKRLYDEFNDWFIAMAAYNAGAARLREAIENQNTNDFFDLYLPEETERYVFRIMALKEIISNRDRYGIKIDDKELYKPVNLQEVTLEVDKEIHSNILAKAMEVSYRTFRLYNLHIRKYKMLKGVYRINVPAEKKDLFLRHLKPYGYIAVP